MSRAVAADGEKVVHTAREKFFTDFDPLGNADVVAYRGAFRGGEARVAERGSLHGLCSHQRVLPRDNALSDLGPIGARWMQVQVADSPEGVLWIYLGVFSVARRVVPGVIDPTAIAAVSSSVRIETRKLAREIDVSVW